MKPSAKFHLEILTEIKVLIFLNKRASFFLKKPCKTDKTTFWYKKSYQSRPPILFWEVETLGT